MRKRLLVCITIIISLISTNIAFGQEIIINGNENIEEFVKKVDTLLQIKYTDPNEHGDESSDSNCVYEINADGEKIKTAFDLKLKIEKYIINKKVLDIEIIDKGHKKENDNILAKEYSRYDRYETSEELYEIYINYKDEKAIKDIKILDKNGFRTDEALKTEKVVITLLNNQEIEIVKGTDKLDFTKCINKNGNRVDLTNVDINTPEGISVAKTVVGFEKAKELGYLKEFDIASKVVENVKVVENALVEEKDLSYFYDGYYSEHGKELIYSLADKVFYRNGDRININYDLSDIGSDEERSKNNISKIVFKEGRYSFDIKMNVVKDVSLYLSGDQNFQLTVYSDNQAKLSRFREDVIDAVVNGSKDMKNREYDILAGDDRFETSVEVSKEYTKANSASGVVLVGENAIVDGLSTAPFAKYKNSPILLTKKDEVPKVVMDEIKRIFKEYSNTDTVYIIGGTDVISDKVRSQLVSEIKDIRLIRISGEDRYETSINISNKMDLSKTDKAYVVGGDGEVDAMSVAPLAVSEGAPIIVTPKGGISKDIKRFIELNENIVDIYVIGGENVIDTKVLMDIKDAANNRKNNKNINIKRVWGDDRQETNAKVIELFNDGSKDRVVVAKDGVAQFSHLVDAMGAAILGYPVVIGTNDITNEQIYAVNKVVRDGMLLQVGNGINNTIIKRLIENI